MKECKMCHKYYQPKARNSKFCCDTCQSTWHNKHAAFKAIYIKHGLRIKAS